MSWEAIQRKWMVQPSILVEKSIAEAVSAGLESRLSPLYQEHAPVLLEAPSHTIQRPGQAWYKEVCRASLPPYLSEMRSLLSEKDFDANDCYVQHSAATYLLTGANPGLVRLGSVAYTTWDNTLMEKVTLSFLTRDDPGRILDYFRTTFPFLDMEARGFLDKRDTLSYRDMSDPKGWRVMSAMPEFV